MKDEQYIQLIEKYPQLTCEGYGVNMDYANGMSRREYFALRRDERQGQQENFELCDDAGPVAGGDQEIKVLKEMNELQQFENDNWSKGTV